MLCGGFLKKDLKIIENNHAFDLIGWYTHHAVYESDEILGVNFNWLATKSIRNFMTYSRILTDRKQTKF